MAQNCSVPFCPAGCQIKDHHRLVRILCEFPCNPSLPCQSQQTRLEDAITDAQANGWGISDDVPDNMPQSPKLPLLHWAALLGRGRALKMLVDEGFSVKGSSNSSMSALSLAMSYMLMSYAKTNEIALASEGFRHVAEVLYKLDATMEDAEGRVALNLACEQYVASLAQPGAECSFRREVLATLLSLTDSSTSEGLSLVNHSDVSGNSPLHILARDECCEFVEMLLTKGADPTLQNKLGKTPCEVAQGCGQHRVARWLFRATSVPLAAGKAPGPSDFLSAEALSAPVPLNGSHAVVLDVSQQVREQVKNHVNSRHAQVRSMGRVHPSDGIKPVRSTARHAPMAGNVKHLRDVCSVDFAVMSQQSMPIDASVQHAQSLLNGISTPTSMSSFAMNVNGDISSELDQRFNSHELSVQAAVFRPDISSPPPLLPSVLSCNGETGQTLHEAISCALEDDQCPENMISDQSSDDEDASLEDALILREEDEFVTSMRQIKASTKPDVLLPIIRAEAKRRYKDCEAAEDHRQQVQEAHKQSIDQLSVARQDCRNLVSQIEDIKLQMMLISDEVNQRNHRCTMLEHERQAVDSQFKLAQLQHQACNRALESLPLAYQMNIAFDGELAAPSATPQTAPAPAGHTGSGGGTASVAAPAVASSPHLETATQYFDSASVSSTPVVHQGLGL